jgi:hypothetical protein
MRFLQPLDVDVMRKRPQRGARHLLRQFRYPFEFR